MCACEPKTNYFYFCVTHRNQYDCKIILVFGEIHILKNPTRSKAVTCYVYRLSPFFVHITDKATNSKYGGMLYMYFAQNLLPVKFLIFQCIT